MTAHGLDYPNFESRRQIEILVNDFHLPRLHNPNMTGSADDWYLKEWMAHFAKRQVDLVNDLGWDKARANFLYHGKQPYRRDMVNVIAQWLGIRPYELLMHPKDAIGFRQMRDSAAMIVAEEEAPPFGHAPRSASSPRPPERKRSPPGARNSG